MHVVQRLQQIHHEAVAGLVLVHLNLLLDDADLFLTPASVKCGACTKSSSRSNACGEVVGGGKQIARHRMARVRVDRRAQIREGVEHVPAFVLEQLVLEKVGDAVGHLDDVGPVRPAKAVVDGAVAGREHRVPLVKARLAA